MAINLKRTVADIEEDLEEEFQLGYALEFDNDRVCKLIEELRHLDRKKWNYWFNQYWL